MKVVDTIRDIGIEAFAHPDSDVSYSPLKYLEAHEKGTVIIFQKSEANSLIGNSKKNICGILPFNTKSLILSVT
jgi:hypothetical protein